MNRLRALLYSTFMAIVTIVTGVVFLPTLLRRDWAMQLSKFWVQILEWGLRNIAGIERSIVGLQNLPDGPAIVAAKHQSMWETIALTAILPHPSFVIKKELRHFPIFGWWCARAGFIFVDRSGGAAALKKMTIDTQAAIAKGTSHVIIFPEGTRVRPGQPGRYRPGVAALAKSLNLPIIPAAHNSGSHWRHHEGTMQPGTITLRFGQPIPPDNSRAALMRAIENAIEPMTKQLEASDSSHQNVHVTEHLA